MTEVLVYDPITYTPWSYEPERRLLARHGVDLVVPGSPRELPDLLPRADVLVVCEHMETADLALVDRCAGVVCYGVGMNAVDLAAAEARGMPVTNVPGFCTEEVATHAITLLLALQRALLPLSRAAAGGTWDLASIPALREVRRMSAQTVGVAGLGRIGRQVARLAGHLGCRVLGFDPFVGDSEVPPGVERVTWDELLTGSDAIVLCSALTDTSRHLVDERALGLVRPGAMLVNVARGGLVDERALAIALRSGRLRGAALDVREVEPPDPGADPLRALDNVILTPHVAGQSVEANDELHERAAARILEVLDAAGRLPAVPDDDRAPGA